VWWATALNALRPARRGDAAGRRGAGAWSGASSGAVIHDVVSSAVQPAQPGRRARSRPPATAWRRAPPAGRAPDGRRRGTPPTVTSRRQPLLQAHAADPPVRRRPTHHDPGTAAATAAVAPTRRPPRRRPLRRHRSPSTARCGSPRRAGITTAVGGRRRRRGRQSRGSDDVAQDGHRGCAAAMVRARRGSPDHPGDDAGTGGTSGRPPPDVLDPPGTACRERPVAGRRRARPSDDVP
jgi:hypothetical protein